MINISEVMETNAMIHEENLDVRTITMGISLLDCITDDLKTTCDKVYDKITTSAKDLVKVGKELETEFGIPIVNKRISLTPIAMVGSSCCKSSADYIEIAKPANDSSQYVIMFYKNSELTKILLAVDYDLLAQINSGIKEVWK